MDTTRLQLQAAAHTPASLHTALATQAAALRGGTLGGAPLILSPRLPTTLAMGSGAPPPLLNPQVGIFTDIEKTFCCCILLFLLQFG